MKDWTYKKYIKSLAPATIQKMKKERVEKLIKPHLLRDRDEIERELEIINEVLEGK